MTARSRAAHILCTVSSILFSLVYLTALLIMAIYRSVTTDSTPKDPSVQLKKEERKLVFDLAHYIRLAGFDLETHMVTTEDGFILEMHHIIDRKVANGQPIVDQAGSTSSQKYPVLLIPGLMQSSASYCTSGPGAIAETLAQRGYDVWLGNNRCGFKPRHVKFSAWSAGMWDWCIRNMATQDMPAMVEYVRKKSGATKIALVAHSQGTTQTFMGLAKSFRPEIGESISSFTALAPAVFAGPLVDRWFLKMLRINRRPYRILMGYRAFLGIMGKMHDWMPLRWYVYLGYIMFHYMLGWSDILWDRHYRDRNFVFSPTYVSAKHMMWWLGKGGFADKKCIFDENDSQWFNEQFPPLAIFAPGRDDLVSPERLINRLRTHENHIDVTVYDLPSYSHLDVLWAKDVGPQVAEPLAEYIWSKVGDKEEWLAPHL